MTAGDAVVVTGVSKSYGSRAAVDDLSLRVRAGSVFALLGTNGAGKTTTIEMLEGYKRPDTGSVRVLDCDPVADANDLRPRMGLMLQSGGIYNFARAEEVVRLFCSLYGDVADPEELIELVGLTDARRTLFRRLSGGEQRRLALAVALAGDPEIVFLDEPTAGMDPKARQVTYGLVRDLRSRGVTVILTTHLLDEAEQLADRVMIIDRGRILAEGTPAELMAGGGLRFGAPTGLDVAVFPKALGDVEELRPGHYQGSATPDPDIVAELATWAAARGVLLEYVTAGARSLEDVFLELVK